jgi:lysophospholipase L1-like esterase
MLQSHLTRTAVVGFGLCILAGVGSASAGEAGDWIGAWSASPQPVWAPDFPPIPTMPRVLFNQTIREIAWLHLGGNRVRVVLSNEYGQWPLKIGEAHVAVAQSGAAIDPASDRKLTFGGKDSITIPPGAPAVSDPVDLAVAPLSSLAVSLFLPLPSPTDTFHWDGKQTAFVVGGNQTAAPDIKADLTTLSRAFLSEVMVDAPAGAQAVATFGDSITDGDGSTPDANHRWPDFLAKRLSDEKITGTAILNQGISGDKVLSDRLGANALARFDRDVLAQPHISAVTLMMGINDIGWPGCALAPNDKEPTAEDIIAGYQQLIARAHDHGIRIIGVTLTPFEDSFKGTPFEGYYTTEKEKIRVAVNDWIRKGGQFDGVIDFDAVVRDPDHPARILAAYDHGDHLHPNDAGYQKMAESIDLGLLIPKK